MNLNKVLLLIIALFFISNSLFAQKKRKIKPVFYGKIQGGLLVDNFIPESISSFNYFNLGIRKVTGEKVREIGLESFYYSENHGIIRNTGGADYIIAGTKQNGFSINSFWYLGLKQWQLSKFKIGLGPQFSLGYYRKEIRPYTTNAFLKRFNDFKIGASGSAEISYPLSPRFSILASTQYTFFQFGVRRELNENPTLIRRQQLKDFAQVDFLVSRYVARIGVLAQFGKIKKDRAKIKKKRDKKLQAKKDKLQKQKAKKQKQKEKEKAKRKKS